MTLAFKLYIAIGKMDTCDVIQGNQPEVEHVTFQFLILLKCSFAEVHFTETLSESDLWFQNYQQLKDSHNKRKQKKSIPFSGYIL